MSSSPLIGVLALQGAYDIHAERLTELGASVRLVRRPEQLAGLDGLIIPGGESTTFLKHLERAGFYDALDEFVHTKPTFGTCAGCILLAKDVSVYLSMAQDVRMPAFIGSSCHSLLALAAASSRGSDSAGRLFDLMSGWAAAAPKPTA